MRFLPSKWISLLIPIIALVVISGAIDLGSAIAWPTGSVPAYPTRGAATAPSVPSPIEDPAQGNAESSRETTPNDARPGYTGITSRGLEAGQPRGATQMAQSATVTATPSATTPPATASAKPAAPRPTTVPKSTAPREATPTPLPLPTRAVLSTATPTVVLTAKPTLSPPSSPSPSPADPSAVQTALGLINQSRAQIGLPPLTQYEPLRQEAQAFTNDMARRGYFSHYTPEGLSPGDRIAAAGIKVGRWAENIGDGHGSPVSSVIQQLHQLMMAEVAPNDGHKQNILSPDLHRLGIGIATAADGTIYYATDFTD